MKKVKLNREIEVQADLEHAVMKGLQTIASDIRSGRLKFQPQKQGLRK